MIAARRRQHERLKEKPKITCNARMGSSELKQYCALDETTMELLKFAMSDLNLSARAYARVLKVARTIADLAGFDRSSVTTSQRPSCSARWTANSGRDRRCTRPPTSRFMAR